MAAAADEYLETRVMTAPPERLHLMVVEAAIRFTRQGIEAVEARNFELSFRTFSRARDCVNELLSAIRADYNPELAGNLKNLFLFCHRNLTLADLHHDSELARGALQILEQHRETWIELLERLRQQPAAAATSVPAGAILGESTRSWEG